MKLKVVLLAMLSTLCGALSINHNDIVTTNAETDAIEDVYTAQSYAGLTIDNNASNSVKTEKGIEVTVPGADTVSTNAWQYHAVAPYSMNDLGHYMDISQGQTVSIKFSVSMVDENGSLAVDSVMGNSLDFAIVNPYDSNKELCKLKIWVDSAGYTCGNHSAELYGPNDNGTYTNFGTAGWINGDATASSSFYFEFSKTDLLKTYLNNNPNELRSVCDNETFKTQMNEALVNVNNVNFHIYGDGGFKESCKVTIQEINGVSVNDMIMQDNLNSVDSYFNLAYKYTATTDEETTTYSDVEFRLLAGVDDTLASYATKHEATAYGVEVSTTTNTLKLNVERIDENIKYAVVGLKDMINNFENAKVTITIRAYMTVNDTTIYSSKTKSYSVVEMVKAYHDAGKAVDGLYTIFANKGAYSA